MAIRSRKRRLRRRAVLGAVMFTLLQTALAASFAALRPILGLPRRGSWLFAALAGLCVLLVIPALAALKERFKEIEGGKYDAAAEY